MSQLSAVRHPTSKRGYRAKLEYSKPEKKKRCRLCPRPDYQYSFLVSGMLSRQFGGDQGSQTLFALHDADPSEKTAYPTDKLHHIFETEPFFHVETFGMTAMRQPSHHDWFIDCNRAAANVRRN
jgi:hypothetical protein